MADVVVTTDAGHINISMDIFLTNNSVPLRVNSESQFTLSYAIWPIASLIFLIVTVWLVVYISTTLSRYHTSKPEQQNFASNYATQDSTIAGGYETSNVISPVDV